MDKPTAVKPIRSKTRVIGMCIGLALLPFGSAMANGLLLPDNDLRSDLTWLADRGVIQLSLTTWPISQDAVEQALKKAHPSYSSEQLAIERVQERMRTLKSDARITGFASTDKPGLPQGFAQTPTANNKLSLAVNQSGEWWDVHLQGNWEGNEQIGSPSHINPNNSYGAVKIWDQWLSFGQTPQWWGPGYEGSLIRSDAARPLTGFMLQRDSQAAPTTWWLNWIGPWQYQISASQMSQYTSVPDTKIIGGRLSFSPWRSLELGASRILQWGGQGRPESFGNFWDGVIGNDNTTANDPNEPGNQLAGFDFKYKLEPTLGIPISFYGQMIGEDESGKLPSANMYLGGIEGHHSWNKDAINWYLEAHDTRTNGSRTGYSYTHHIYKGGYYQQGYPLGDAMGGDGRLLAAKTELVTEDNQRWSVRVAYVKVNPENEQINSAFPHADTLKGVQLGWGGDVYRSVRLNLGLWYTDANNSDSNDVGASAQLDIPLNL
ncbi:capsule assembly Wzi family protein [Rouxiella sp. S1S-2]|nr:capsule assembly Wzi family protein [Rouxiella sp. S1S-2]